MSSREGTTTRISGHTDGNGGRIDAHTEHVRGAPGPYDGPMDGRVVGYPEETATNEIPLARRSMRARSMPASELVSRGNGDGRSVVDLLRELSTDTGTLIRQEMDLVKAEMREKFAVYQKGMVSIGIGAALLLAALMTGLWAVNSGLTALLAQFMDLEIAVWLSPLMLTIALAAFGWSMVKGGTARMSSEGLVPDRTTTSLREDKRWAQAKMHEIKEELTHGR